MTFAAAGPQRAGRIWGLCRTWGIRRTWGSGRAAFGIVALLVGCAAPQQEAKIVPAFGHVSTPAQPSLPPLPVGVSPAEVMGLDRLAVQKLLGDPGMVRREPPGEVWQYRTAACVLDIFLYDQASGARVLYAEARTRTAEPAPTDSCVGHVISTRQSLPSS